VTLRVLLTGGGTGGHIYPALAIAEALKQDPDVAAILYVGKTGGLEESIIPNAGIDFKGIRFFGMPRRVNGQLIGWFWQLGAAIQISVTILKAFQPTVVMGTGGYVSAPVLMAAKLLGIPYMVHEPDAQAGLVNRLMGQWAATVTTAFAGSPHAIVTGNPLRNTIGHWSKQEALKQLGIDRNDNRQVFVVSGGSQGAQRINDAVVQALPKLIQDCHLTVIHQTGAKNFDATQQAAAALGFDDHPHYCVRPFFEAMGLVWAAGDMAICRAGSLTLSELFLSGLPSILVPYPYAAADHQMKNARTTEAAGAAVVLPDANCTADSVLQQVNKLLLNPETLTAMQNACLRLAKPNATKDIVAHLKRVGHHSLKH